MRYDGSLFGWIETYSVQKKLDHVLLQLTQYLFYVSSAVSIFMDVGLITVVILWVILGTIVKVH